MTNGYDCLECLRDHRNGMPPILRSLFRFETKILFSTVRLSPDNFYWLLKRFRYSCQKVPILFSFMVDWSDVCGQVLIAAASYFGGWPVFMFLGVFSFTEVLDRTSAIHYDLHYASACMLCAILRSFFLQLVHVSSPAKLGRDSCHFIKKRCPGMKKGVRTRNRW